MTDTVNFEPGEGLLALAAESRFGARVVFNEPLAKHCSLRIGGPAAVWAEVETAEELVELARAGEAEGLELTIAGLGSNTLFPDEGIRGIVARLTGELAAFEIAAEADDDTAVMRIGAGAVNAHVVRALHKGGWVGAEFLALIPGTFGGAVVMNAGTKEAELSEVLLDVDVLEPDGAGGYRRSTWEPAKLGLSYRHSEVSDDVLVLGGRIRIRRGDVDEARQAVRRDKARRNRTQPYKLASVGSTFANPKGDYAGRVIEEVGLKGHAIGGARISELHANFFINENGATAADFLELMALARSRVRHRFGLELRPEVRFVGFDGFKRMLEYERRLEEQGC
ncbi:UDP-N-acetylmuramate dehydrogenase [Persicimonas caeni]|nr:UDP-N-acetylmuramate dehydrogenase [Persicimonas caeni]